MFLCPAYNYGPGQKNLLGTALTWKELEQDLVAQYGSKASLGPRVVVNDIAHGKGFVARTGVIENIDKNCMFEDRSVPNGQLVIKIVSMQEKTNNSLNGTIEAQQNETKMHLLKQMHNAECKIFHKLSGRDLFPGPHAYITKPIGYRRKGYVLMDFHEKMMTLKPFEYLEKSLVYKILDVLAKFHACSQFFSETEMDQLSERIVSDIFRPLILNRLLCHGDPWLGNFLFSEENGRVYVNGLIDFQTSHFGNVGHDLSRLFCYVLSPEERRKSLNDYVSYYCHSFQSHWPISQPSPFTCNQVITACDRYFPLTAYVVVLLTGAHGEERCRDSEDPEGARRFLLKKISCLVEDMQKSIRFQH